MNTKQTITVDEANGLPHGTVRRAPTGFAHAILLDQMGREAKWHIIDLYGPIETNADGEVADWPIVYVPAPDEVWETMNPNRLEELDTAEREKTENPLRSVQGGPPPLTREISDKIVHAFVAATIPSEMTRGLIERGVFAPPVSEEP